MTSGYTACKFFPAEQAGSTALLKAFAGLFHETVFCPTGGINATKAEEYLALSKLLCVGGCWVAPADMMNNGNWDGITALAREAVDTLGG